jgi:diamine N-acetyltransferase
MEYLNKPVILYGLLLDDGIVGCVAIERSKRETRSFYIERLSVAPIHRHHGHGRKLMDFAVDAIRRMDGCKASIGIMNQNKILKDWYIGQGFIEQECKQIAHLPFEVCYMVKPIQE